VHDSGKRQKGSNSWDGGRFPRIVRTCLFLMKRYSRAKA
jgi:hypothetical protein